jgi:hypothetical protein
VAVLEIEEFIADVPVGPGSAPTLVAEAAPVAERVPVVDGLGPLQVLSRSVRYSRTESPRHYPDNDLVVVTRVAAWIADAPAYGIASHSIRAASESRRRSNTARVRATRRSLENDVLAIAVRPDGTVSLDERETGRRIASLLAFIDEGDEGDLYTPAPRPRSVAVEFRGVRLVHRGPLRGELALRYRVVDRSIGRGPPDVELTVNLVLDAGASFARISVCGENHRENHRLRIVVGGDVVPSEVWADAAFGAVRRDRLLIGDAEAAVEQAPPTAPLHRYVSTFNASAGFTLFSDGLAEYESREDGSLLVTLVRAVGELSRNDLPERPGHAGWPSPTPEAQCQGPFEAGFAVMLHGPRVASTIDAIERAADNFLCPLTGTTLRSALRLPAPVSGVELRGSGLGFSTIKESEDGGWLVLRCINLLDESVDGAWRLPFDIREARLARLDETTISDLVPDARQIVVRASPRGIVTILAR